MKNDIFKLTIPSKPDYISVARLTSSSIASKIGFNIDDIDDIKVCIAEACINALNKNDQIDIIFKIHDNEFIMEVENVSMYGKEDNKEIELGVLIIKSLMDEVNFSEKGVEMIKYIEDGSI